MLVTPSTSAKAPSKITSTATVGPGQTMATTPNKTAMNPRRAIAPQLRVIASSMSITSCFDDEGSCRRLPPPEEGRRAYHRKKVEEGARRRDDNYVGNARRARTASERNPDDEFDGACRRTDP